MAEVRVAKPEAGQQQNIACGEQAQFVFAFAPNEATITREGDNLNIAFDDGGSVSLDGFYSQYNSDNLPSFNIDGMEVSAEDFFTAMNEPDLMPAAGPATNTAPSAADGARYHEYGDMAFMGGIEHLNGLDWGMNRSFEWYERPNAVGEWGDDGGWQTVANAEPAPAPEPVNHPVTLTPIDPDELPSNTPDIPPSSNNPDDKPGDNPGGNEDSGLNLGRDVRVVDEADLGSGPVSVNGGMLVDAPDGVGSIVMAGRIVWANGAPVEHEPITTDEGVFSNIAFDPATGQLTYTFTLNQATQEHGQEGTDHIAHSVPVTVTDVDGDSASGIITIVIKDDVPTIEVSPASSTSSCQTSILIDFTNELFKDGAGASSLDAFRDLFAPQDPAHWGTESQTAGSDYSQINGQDGIHWVVAKGIKLIPTRVVYDVESGHIDNLLDKNSEIYTDGGFKPTNDDKNLFLSNDGLGMGTTDNATNWGGNGFGSFDGQNNPLGEGKLQAEGFVLEPANGSVWYELDLDLSNFDAADGDRVVIYFYMTPQNNNDDNIAYKVEIDKNSGYLSNDGDLASIKIPVPDGFTKAIVAAMPKEDGSPSSFTVARLNLSKNAIEHSGEFSVDFGADGAAAENAITWDWSGIEQSFDGKDIVVSDTLGAGTYRLEFIYLNNGQDVEAVLVGQEGAQSNLNGNPLFRAHLDTATGKWTVDQFYKFGCEGVDIKNLQFTITATDADGDSTSVNASLNMWSESGFDRFDNVELGNWDPAWGYDAGKDTGTDVLGGGDGNDLMYGRGGHDLMFGDGGDDAALKLVAALGLSDKLPTIDEIKADIAKLGGGWSSDNSKRGLIYQALQSDRLEDALKILEENEGAGGNDAMFGGLGRDIMFGGAGDDYLVGTGSSEKTYEQPDQNMLFGGSGNDIIVYNKNDYIEHGGSGIDLLLVGKNDPASLHDILKYDSNSADVRSIEVMLRAEHTGNVENLGITSHETLAKYGVTITHGEDGKSSMSLSNSWQHAGSYVAQNDQGDWITYQKYTYEGAQGEKLTLETSLTPSGDRTFSDEIAKTDAPGTAGDDIIIAGAGNDYIDGGAGKDNIDAGAGNDIIVYDKVDGTINGGSGIDLLLTNSSDGVSLQGDDTAYTLRQLQVGIKKPGHNLGEDRPDSVENIEMMLIGMGNTDVKNLGITSYDDLAEYGILIQDGTIYLDSKLWEDKATRSGEPGQNSDIGIDNSLYCFSYNKDGVQLDLNIVRDHTGFPKINWGSLPDAAAAAHEADDSGMLFSAVAAAYAAEDGREASYGDVNDIIMLDTDDFLIDGGDDEIDIMITDRTDISLAELIGNVRDDGTRRDESKPFVRDVEVLLSGGIAGIASLAELAEFGVRIDPESQKLLLDGDQWQLREQEGGGDGTQTTYIYDHVGGDLTLETTLGGDRLSLYDPDSGAPARENPLDGELLDGTEALAGLDIEPRHEDGGQDDGQDGGHAAASTTRAGSGAPQGAAGNAGNENDGNSQSAEAAGPAADAEAPDGTLQLADADDEAADSLAEANAPDADDAGDADTLKAEKLADEKPASGKPQDGERESAGSDSQEPSFAQQNGGVDLNTTADFAASAGDEMQLVTAMQEAASSQG